MSAIPFLFSSGLAWRALVRIGLFGARAGAALIELALGGYRAPA
jgi:hypothetical protein